jgi:hypothetical protein
MGNKALCCLVLATLAAVVLAGADSAPSETNKGTPGVGRCPLSVQQLSDKAPVASVTAVKRACKRVPPDSSSYYPESIWVVPRPAQP